MKVKERRGGGLRKIHHSLNLSLSLMYLMVDKIIFLLSSYAK